MSDYEIGRDLQELRSRVERLEGVMSGGERSAGVGANELHRTSGGIDAHKTPIVWKQQKGTELPPFSRSVLGLSHPIHADATEVITWTCTPEPLILNVYLSGGRTDEYCRFSGQTFSRIRFTDPNTGKTTARVTYAAQLTASGRWQPDWTRTTGNSLFFGIIVRGDSGGVLFTFSQEIYIRCGTNTFFQNSYDFEPALFDDIKGATWDFEGWQSVLPC